MTPRNRVSSTRLTATTVTAASETDKWPGPTDITAAVISGSSTEALPTVGRARPDALAAYIKSVGEVPLLTPPQEAVLAARSRRGDAAARDWMIRANLRLVIKIAREYEHLG
ncbi:MAG TPA: sigma-70 factor domain-containing protein, partial [Methylomirabilota bacterium]|nr:sigma-70 factor domain-containing protein [Methylomirabilota bacterium]